VKSSATSNSSMKEHGVVMLLLSLVMITSCATQKQNLINL